MAHYVIGPYVIVALFKILSLIMSSFITCITSLHHYIITSLHHYIITSLHHRTLCNRLLCRCSLCHRSLPRRHGPNFDDQKSEKVCDLWYIRLIRNLCHQCCHRFSFGRLILANNSRGSRKHCLYLHCHNRLL